MEDKWGCGKILRLFGINTYFVNLFRVEVLWDIFIITNVVCKLNLSEQLNMVQYFLPLLTFMSYRWKYFYLFLLLKSFSVPYCLFHIYFFNL